MQGTPGALIELGRCEAKLRQTQDECEPMSYFVVINEQGPSWVPSRPMREQPLWDEHAAFVNSLMYAGFVVLGGPLGDGGPHRAMLIINSDTEQTVRSRLAEDPWIRAGILRLGSLESWKILVSQDKLDPVLAEISAQAHQSEGGREALGPARPKTN
jgi:hypothetical protein